MSRTDSASLVVQASSARAYAALTNAAALEVWLPPTGMSGRFEHFEPRPGGRYRMVLSYADGSSGRGKTTSESDVVEGRFLDLEPDKRVVQAVGFVSNDPAFSGSMTMTWELQPVGEATRVVVRAENVPPGISPEAHEEGMASSLHNLAAYVEDQNPSSA